MSTNRLGKRGESIFSTKISKHFLLDPSFLGDKYESIDFIIDLNTAQTKKAFFFVSVKTTAVAKYSPKANRLEIQVKKKELAQLKKFKIPTYIVGIDEGKEKAFIVAVKGISAKSIKSIPTKFSINNKTNLQALFSEVELYWNRAKDHRTFTSKFIYK